MTVLIFGVLLALFDVFYPRSNPGDRGLQGWYAMRSFAHPFEVILYGSVVWIGPPAMGVFLWGRLT